MTKTIQFRKDTSVVQKYTAFKQLPYALEKITKVSIKCVN